EAVCARGAKACGQVVAGSREIRWSRVEPLVVVEFDGRRAEGVGHDVAENAGGVTNEGGVRSGRRILVAERVDVRPKVAERLLTDSSTSLVRQSDHARHLWAGGAGTPDHVPAFPNRGRIRADVDQHAAVAGRIPGEVRNRAHAPVNRP